MGEDSGGGKCTEGVNSTPNAIEQSLYKRLGGYDAIAAAVDDLLTRLYSDPQLGGY